VSANSVIHPARVFARRQGLVAAIINAMLNPFLAWLGNREMVFVPPYGGGGAIVDTAVTSIVLSVLVALFMTAGVHRDVRAGRIAVQAGIPRAGWLQRLPRNAWALGLLLGLGVAIILISLMLGLFQILERPGFPFLVFASIKAAYTALVAFLVAICVIYRQLSEIR